MGVNTAHSVSLGSNSRARGGHPPTCHENFTYHPNLPLHACQDVRLNLFAVLLSAPLKARRPSGLVEMGHYPSPAAVLTGTRQGAAEYAVSLIARASLLGMGEPGLLRLCCEGLTFTAFTKGDPT